MAGLNHTPDLFCRRPHHGGIGHRKINLLYGRRIAEIAADCVWNDHGIVSHFRFTEGVDPFLESADDGERQTADLEHVSDGFFGRTVKLLGKFLGNHTNFVVGLLVLGIEEPAGENHQVADFAVLRINAKNLNIPFFSAA